MIKTLAIFSLVSETVQAAGIVAMIEVTLVGICEAYSEAH